MADNIVIAGGGIGGLAAALACTRVGIAVRLLEQASQFSEVGAGVQLGPNVVRVLQSWGLGDALKVIAFLPARLEVRNALNATLLGVLPLGQDMEQRYGAPYATVARADLHRAVLSALQRGGSAELLLDRQVQRVSQTAESVQIHTKTDEVLQADVLVGADGLWSQVRAAVVNDGPPRVTGHLAYRTMVHQAELPERLRSQVITVWLGPRFHVVQYPVRGGAWLNVVAIVHSSAVPGNAQRQVHANVQSWDHNANALELRALLASAGSPLLDLLHALDSWRLWALCDRPPMAHAGAHAKGRIALLGDAAHPMRPYLAQGAGMAIEDAAALAQALSQPGLATPEALQRYASQRWQRNARVQARAVRNGEMFHATGLKRWARDTAMKLLGPRILDVPWLYKGG